MQQLCDDELIELADRYGFLKQRLDKLAKEVDRIKTLLLSSNKSVIEGDVYCVRIRDH